MIEARGLTKRYGGTLAVDNLSFTGGFVSRYTSGSSQIVQAKWMASTSQAQ